jgi:hypothetical protein
MDKKTRACLVILWVISLLGVASLACSQAGDILTPEEATARVQASKEPKPELESVSGATFQEGDNIKFVGTGYLVPLRKNPGDQVAYSHAGRGDTGVILGSREVEDVIWYQVKGPSGEGWVEVESIELLEGESAATVEGLQPGAEVYLVGKGFLINILSEPGGRLVANQERGVLVTIIQVTEHEGEQWYYINAPGGEGWVLEENLTQEQP